MSRLEIVPQNLQVHVDNSFELTVRAFGGDGHVVPIMGSNLVWTLDGLDPGQLELGWYGGTGARFKAVRVAGSPVKITATLGLVTALATATVIKPPVSNTEPIDFIKAPHDADTPLEFALINGMRGATPVADEFVAFAAGARLENLKGPGTLAVFSTERRLSYSTVTDWLAGQHTVTASPTGAPTERVIVPLNIWDATTNGLPPPRLPDLSVAQLVYRTNRTGVRFEQVGGEGMPVRLPPTSVYMEDCLKPEAKFTVYDPLVPAVHVFVVEAIDGSAKGGWHCSPDADPARKARAIFVAQARNFTTLAHELGHLLALLEPDEGHSDCAPGFDEANLMWRWLDDLHANNRMDLSLGQAFRIAGDKRSWVTTLGQGAITAPPSCEIPGAPCPPLSHPVPPPAGWETPGWCTPPPP